MGFLEYARSMFFEKNRTKTKILVTTKSEFPQFSNDENSSITVLPEPAVRENEYGEKTIWLMGYCFPADAQGKRQSASLFRAAASHLSAHSFFPSAEDYRDWKESKDLRLAKFTRSIMEDVKANAYISTRYPERLIDLAFANTLALKRLHPINNLINPATKIMAGLLIEVNTGFVKVQSKSENAVIASLVSLLNQFRKKTCSVFEDDNLSLKDEKLEIADRIYSTIEQTGPIIEAPFLPHTEEIGKCSIFYPSFPVDSDIILDNDFRKCLEFLAGTLSFSEDRKDNWRKRTEVEAAQVFNSWEHEKEKNKKMIARYEDFVGSTRFKSVSIPQLCFADFLESRVRCKSEAHRLIESLLVVRDAIDEDPRKMYGVLDLQEVIQVVASKSPRMDVFMLGENISKSYAWIILLDASGSMKVLKDFALDLFVMAAEAANQLLLDSASWGMYAFNDRFLVVKDPSERYNIRVKSRIGGIEFEGFTYMPDALQVAGQIIKERNENLRLITIISDGWPYGYSSIDGALSETLEILRRRNIVVIGIGARTRRMQLFFRNYCTVDTLQDLKKKFSNLYMEASRIAVQT